MSGREHSANALKRSKTSGSIGFDAILQKLNCARLGRSNLFIPPHEESDERVATKLRQKALDSMADLCRLNSRITVVWTMSYDKPLFLWRGTVVKHKRGGGWWVCYDHTPGMQFPFPPKDPRVGKLNENSLSKNLVINIEKSGGNYPCTF